MLGCMPLKDFFDDPFLCPPQAEEPLPETVKEMLRHRPLERGKSSSEGDSDLLLSTVSNQFKHCEFITFSNTSLNLYERDACRLDLCKHLTHVPDNATDAQEAGRSMQVGFKVRHAQLAFMIEEGRDPFNDPNPGVDASQCHLFQMCDGHIPSQSMECIGRIAQISAQILAQQHRTSCFILFICKTQARIIRWDRAGAIVTRAFNYRTTPYLLDFLWRFDHASASDRGIDVSQTAALREEELAFKQAIENHVKLQIFNDLMPPEEQRSLREHIAKHYEPGNVTKLAVYDEKTKAIQHYLVSRPTSLPKNMTGRCTRGYWAAKPNDDCWEIIFVKDTWRVDADDAPKEGSTYEVLNANHAQNVPTMCGHGDVRQSDSPDGFPCLGDTFDESNIRCQKTVTQSYVRAKWSARAGREVMLKPLTHYRLVLAQAAVTLNDFNDSRELFTAAHDVITALQCAHDTRLLHRDISLSNILLFRKAKGGRRYGLLSDWDVSCTTNDQGIANYTSIAGTWPYLSVEAARGLSGFRHTVQDDMESLLYVLLYSCMTLLPHADVEDLGSDVADFFDEATDGLSLRKRGLTKQYWILHFPFAVESIRSYHFEEGVEQLLIAVFEDLHGVYLQAIRSDPKSSGEALLRSDWTIEKMAQVFGDFLGNTALFIDSKTDKWLAQLQEYRKQVICTAHYLP